jgi:hypothetical protein
MSDYNERNLYALYIAIVKGYTTDEALNLMGIKPTKHTPKHLNLTYEEKMEMLVKRNSGATYIELSEEYDISEIYLCKLLKKFTQENNLPLRCGRDYKKRRINENMPV